MTGTFAGQAAVVTGGASGIGAATVRLLVEHGASVLIADRDDHQGEALAKELGDGSAFLHTDVTEPSDVERMVATAVERWGGLHLAVNNAGMSGTYAKLPEQPLDDWHRVLAVNLTSMFLCLQAEIPAIQA